MTFAELEDMLFSQTATETAALRLLPQTARYSTLLERGCADASEREWMTEYEAGAAFLPYELDGRGFTSTEEMFGTQQGMFHLVQQERYRTEPLHRHRFFEIIIIYAGSCTMELDGEKTCLQTRDVCLLNLNTPHRILPLGAGDIVLCIRMKQDLMAGSRMENGVGDNPLMQQFYFARARGETVAPYLLLHCAERDHFGSILRLMACEYFESDVLSFPVLVGCFAPFFAELTRAWAPLQSTDPHSYKTNRLDSVLDYIKRFSRVCTVEDVAARFGYAPTYLSAVIKKRTGKSFSELRREHRVQNAAELLATTPDPIAEIAANVGYSNLTYFYKVFQEHYGVTPQAYRESKRR